MCVPSKLTLHLLSTCSPLQGPYGHEHFLLMHQIILFCPIQLSTSHVGPNTRTAPVLGLLASQVTKFLLSPGFLWLIIVRQSQLTTSRLMLLNVYWWIDVYGVKVVLHSLCMRG